MSLKALLSLSQGTNIKQGISEQRVSQSMNNIRGMIAFFREYPDLFIDFIKGPDCKFNFYFYQRVFLRVAMRHRYVYATFPRAFSKSFLSMMALVIRCVLYPNSELFITTGGKQQAASITMAKIQEICRLIPALANQINWDRGQTRKSKDDVQYKFKNGSKLNILTASEKSRGQRRTGGLMEECILIDGTILNEVIIPTTNVDRRLPDGTRDSTQTVNKSQIYITTAGWKNSFAYQKLVQLLIESILNPDQAMIIGGTYTIPVTEGLLNEDFVDQLKLSGTFNEDSFDRQYRSKWSGDAESAFFSSEKFDKHRVLLQPQKVFSERSSKSAYYLIAVDVGRIGCTTEAVVFKVTPQPQGSSLKSVVNIYSYQAQHFGQQALHLKKLFLDYKARKIVIDANGLGIGLVDFMVLGQQDPQTGDYLPPFGVENDDQGLYKGFRTPDTIQQAMYLIKANASINTQAYSNAQSQMSSGKVRLLIGQQEAKVKLMSTKKGQEMDVNSRNAYLQPFVMTDILRQQMLNLIQQNQGINIILKQASRGIRKDKVSAFIYGLYYIKKEQERKNRRHKNRLSNFLFFN